MKTKSGGRPIAPMDRFDIYPNLVKRFGLATGVIASLAIYRQRCATGPFTMPITWIAEGLGLCEKSAYGAVAELTECGHLIHVGGGGATGKPKLYKLGESHTHA